MTTTTATCPQCGTAVSGADRFCESCGYPLRRKEFGTWTVRGTVTEPCPECGTPRGADEYCASCGGRLPDGTDHYAADLGAAAVISDIGLVHAHNEDGVAAAVTVDDGGRQIAAVVCDGISTVQRPEDAAMVGSRAALVVLADDLATGAPGKQSMVAAVAAAVKAIAGQLRPGDTEPPACTFVAARVAAPATGPAQVTVGSVGDSRAYWLARGFGRSRRLTEDDSWAAEMVRAGMDERAAMAAPQAHAITRWLGADIAHDPDATRPRLVEFEADGPGVLLLCSDGLWNHLSEADALAQQVFAADRLDLAEAARRLVDLALAGGGEDNITIVLVDLTAAPEPDQSSAATVVLRAPDPTST